MQTKLIVKNKMSTHEFIQNGITLKGNLNRLDRVTENQGIVRMVGPHGTKLILTQW